MDKNYVVLGIVAVLIIGIGALYMMKSSEGNGPEKNESVENILIIKAIEKRVNASNYYYQYLEKIDDNYSRTITIAEANGRKMVEVKGPIYSKTLYFESSESTPIICAEFDEERKCARDENNTFLAITNQLKSYLFSESSELNLKRLKVLYKSGAIEFLAPDEKTTFNGKECTKTTYKVDYSKLSLEELNEMGLSPNDPSVLYSGNYIFEYCIDEEGDILYSTLNYTYFGKRRTTKTETIEMVWGGNELEIPNELVNESELKEFILEGVKAENVYLNCLQSSERDNCIKEYALKINSAVMCLLAREKKDSCLIILAPKLLKEELCNNITNSSLRDDCFVEIGIRKNETAICEKVAEENKKKYCINMVENGSECSSDSDCVVAGCSGQLCVPKIIAGNFITTCEWKSEYGCLNYASCECVEGKCKWEKLNGYDECMGYINNPPSSGGVESNLSITEG